MRFLVIGEALVDLVQSRHDARFTAHAGGSPFNVAVTLGRLGERVVFAGQFGHDGFGQVLTARLREAGVQLDCWRQVSRPSSLAVAAVDDCGKAGYSFYFENTAGLAFADAPDLPHVDVLHAGSIASWLPPASHAVRQALQKAKSAGALISYDPNVRPALIADLDAVRADIERCIALAHVVKASDEDAALLYDGMPLDEVAARWCGLGAALVVITRGADGAVAYGASGELAACPAPRIVVADTVGAGDSFAGGLLAVLVAAGLADPAGLADAARPGDPRLAGVLRSAVTVSAITCERPGADPPTRAELAARLAETPVP